MLQKAFSKTPNKKPCFCTGRVWILAVVAVVVAAGVLVWQQLQAPEVEQPPVDETADWITYVIMLENRSFEEARSLFQYEPLISPPSETEEIIGEVKALKQSGVGVWDRVGKVQEIRVLIPQNSKVYTLATWGTHLSVFNQMLSTFRFLDPVKIEVSNGMEWV